MKSLSSLIIGSFSLLLLASGAPPRAAAATVAAQAGVVANTAVVDFPRDVTFTLELAPGHGWDTAVLDYDVDRFSCVPVDTRAPVEIVDDRAAWRWVMSRSGNPPPGVAITWQWTLTAADGRQATTAPQRVTLADDRFEWRTVEAEGVTVHWYRGDDVGPLLLDAAQAGLAELAGEMGVTLDDDVTFYIYGSSDEMREAVLFVQDWAGALAYGDYNTILMGVPPRQAETWGVNTVRHELAHLVVNQFARSCVGGDRPTWLEEGLAVVAEGVVAENVARDIEQARATDGFEPLRSLNGAFPAHDSAAGIAYSQSYSVVDYTLATYGPAAMRDLLHRLAAGEALDVALVGAFGVDLSGLESGWRASLGLGPAVARPTATAMQAARVPTVAPVPAPADRPTPAGLAATPPASPGVQVCGLGVFVLVVGVAWGRRRPTRGLLKKASCEP